MTSLAIATDIRREVRSRRLGPDATCAICGMTNPEALMRVSKNVIDRHHIAGSALEGDLWVTLCRNHHAIAQEALRDGGIPMEPPPGLTVVERAALILRAIASFLSMLAESARGLADELSDLVGRLDTGMPGWREL